MGRLFILILLIALLYVLWDRGTFGNRTDTGPAQHVGEAIDRGVAKAARAVAGVGQKVESAAEGTPTPTLDDDR